MDADVDLRRALAPFVGGVAFRSSFGARVNARTRGGFSVGAPAGFPRRVRGLAFCIRPGDDETGDDETGDDETGDDETGDETGNEGFRPRPRGYDLDVAPADSESGREATATRASASAGDGWRCVDARFGGEARALVDDARWDTLTWRDTGAGSVFYLRDVELAVDPGTTFPGERDPKADG